MTDNEDGEIEILRDRLREYRDLLEILYHFLIAKDLQQRGAINSPENILRLKLEEHGIGSLEQKPIFDKKDF